MISFTRLATAFLFVFLSASSQATAQNDIHRYQALTAQLRCLVCQNENLADSDAPLAKDLRQTILSKMTAGESDVQIIQFLTQRYGEFILFQPTMTKKNTVLWLGPAMMLLLAGILFIVSITAQQRKARKKIKLSNTEKTQLEQLLK